MVRSRRLQEVECNEDRPCARLWYWPSQASVQNCNETTSSTTRVTQKVPIFKNCYYCFNNSSTVTLKIFEKATSSMSVTNLLPHSIL